MEVEIPNKHKDRFLRIVELLGEHTDYTSRQSYAALLYEMGRTAGIEEAITRLSER